MNTTTIEAPSLEQIIARMKSEILVDITNGTIPETCASFGELHDYVDANCYGGFCNDEFSDKWGMPSDEGYPNALIELADNAQNAIDAWLNAGRPND